ncbi:hypothetical protein, conserved, partial [Babesia bigemina]
DPVLEYVQRQLKDATNQPTKSLVNPPPTVPPTDPANRLTKIKGDVDKLLEHLKNNTDARRIHNYDHPFTVKLASLKNATNDLSPSAFANPRHPELLDAVKNGLQGFVEQMGRVYVNGYDGHEEKVDMGKLVDTDGKLTDDGRKLSKIFLTCLPGLNKNLNHLRKQCDNSPQGAWRDLDVCMKNKNDDNKLGLWFHCRGYKVSDTKDTHNGELNIKQGESHNRIHGLLVHSTKNEYIFKSDDDSVNDRPLKQLCKHLETYYAVTHLRHIPSPKAPRNVYQMLQWLSGLQWNNMFGDLKRYFDRVFAGLREEYKLAQDALEVSIPDDLKGIVRDRKLRSSCLSTSLRKVCEYSEEVLIAILGHGHGHPHSRYAVDFSTNADKLDYPSSVGSCFGMLVDIAERVYHQLCFLHRQCENDSKSGGWKECWYGKQIAGSSWQCNEKQCGNQACPQIADQKDKQTDDQNADQRCDQHPNCGLKSPLQSFLEDGLVGFIPHQLTKVGCGVKCTLGDHRGLPCKTPMGLTDLSTMASHTKKGEDLKKILDEFCGRSTGNLSVLCAFLKCVLHTPPQTLGDMFAFFYGYLDHWKGEGVKHKQTAFDAAVTDAYFGQAYELDPTPLFGSSTHPKKHPQGDLFSIVKCTGQDESICGVYLQSLSFNTYNIYTVSNNKYYLSWIVYLTETFYQFLCKLRDECCNNCNKTGTRCHGNMCVKGCKVQDAYKKGTGYWWEESTHDDKCKSVSECPLTLPTLNKYGFAFWSAYSLSNNKHHKHQKRTCEDFCNALQNVLNNEESKKHALAEFVFKTIPEFLWKIREKFFWTTVSLWLLSLFYLLHIMVIRLDLLHIKSHLHSPSSHRIAAQSLLAAARVNKLNRVFYLQP